jgi:hypothetical protein
MPIKRVRTKLINNEFFAFNMNNVNERTVPNMKRKTIGVLIVFAINIDSPLNEITPA